MPDEERIDDQSASATVQGQHFPATHWQLVAKVREGGEPRRAALDELCTLYWHPIYAFLRRQGHAREDAEDLTQGFFVKVLADETLEAADADKGRLRTFLLQALKRHVTDRIRHETSLKRGGARRPLSLEAQSAEARYISELTDDLDPETIYLRSWCKQILSAARERLRETFVRTGQEPLFEMLAAFLETGDAQTPYSTLAARTGMTEVALRLHVFRLRQKLRTLVKEEIAQTVSSPEELEAELKWFASMLAAA